MSLRVSKYWFVAFSPYLECLVHLHSSAILSLALKIVSTFFVSVERCFGGGKRKKERNARSVHLVKPEILGSLRSNLSIGSPVMFPKAFS